MRTVPINKLVRSTHHHTSSLLRWFCGVGWMAHRGGVLYAAVQASASARRASRWRTAVSGVWDSTLDTLALGERGSWSTLFTWWSGAFCFKNDFDLLRPLLVNVVKMCKYILFRHFFHTDWWCWCVRPSMLGATVRTRTLFAWVLGVWCIIAPRMCYLCTCISTTTTVCRLRTAVSTAVCTRIHYKQYTYTRYTGSNNNSSMTHTHTWYIYHTYQVRVLYVCADGNTGRCLQQSCSLRCFGVIETDSRQHLDLLDAADGTIVI